MRNLPRALALPTVAAWALAAGACGASAGGPSALNTTAPRVVSPVPTTVPPADGAVDCPVGATGDAGLVWLVEVCHVVVGASRPAVVELLPAITGDHAPAPDGSGYDWPAVAAACEQMAATLPALAEVRGRVPDDLAYIGDLLDLYGPDLRAFTEVCASAAAAEDTDALRAEVDRTARIGQVLTDVRQAIEQRA